jgi:3-hydroxy-9,10-secoandrosta-1,3,5(10)-triene-9,17-dione monooxygenase
VNGAWNWASGSYHADWSYVGVPIVDANGDFAFPATVLIPNTDITIEDTWFVAGMKGTGSNTIHAKDVFVPDHRVQPVPNLLMHDYATPFKDEVPYRSAFVPVAVLILAGPQLGLAQAALDYVIAKGHTRGIAYTEYEVQRDAPTFQLQIAKAATLVETAHMFAYKAADDIDAAAAADRPMTRFGSRQPPCRYRPRHKRVDLWPLPYGLHRRRHLPGVSPGDAGKHHAQPTLSRCIRFSSG